jgi:hypothetical protein
MTTLTRHDTSPTEAEAAATEAFLFGYPLVLMARTRGDSPAHAFVHDAVPRADDPPAATLASGAWLDLEAEPVVLSVSDCHGRYYALSLIDMWTNVFASIGPRTTGTGAGSYAIGGPRWNGGTLPAGVLPITAPTSLVRIAGQTQIGRTAGRHAPPGLEHAYRLEPLNPWREDHRDAPAGAHAPAPPPLLDPVEQLEGLDAMTFFAELATLLEGNPPRLADRAVVARMRRSGVLPAAGEDPSATDSELRVLRERGLRRGLARIRGAAGTVQDELVGSWRMRYPPGPYGTDYLRRAVVARAGLFGTSIADEVRAVISEDAEGRPLSGAHGYRLQFAAGEPPPVRGFWSLSSGRSAIGDADGLMIGADGSLTLYIEPEPPRARDQRSNWLPTPHDGFSLELRMFWPDNDVLDRRWAPPAVTRVA